MIIDTTKTIAITINVELIVSCLDGHTILRISNFDSSKKSQHFIPSFVCLPSINKTTTPEIIKMAIKDGDSIKIGKYMLEKIINNAMAIINNQITLLLTRLTRFKLDFLVVVVQTFLISESFMYTFSIFIKYK